MSITQSAESDHQGDTSPPVATAPAKEPFLHRLKLDEGWYKSLLQFAISIGSAILIWDLVVRIFAIPTFLAPSPLQVLNRLYEEWSVQIVTHSMVTLREAAAGFVLAVAIGIPLAVLITYSKVAGRLLYPLMVSSQVVPKVAIAPLFVVWFGFGPSPKILVAFLTAFFVIVVNTTVGFNSVDPNMLHLARSMSATTLQMFRKVRLPAALPNIFGALKVAVTLAIVGAIVGEFVGSDSGLGYLVLVAAGNVDTPLVFGSIVMMAVIGMGMFLVVAALERVFIPWQRSHRLQDLQGGGTA